MSSTVAESGLYDSMPRLGIPAGIAASRQAFRDELPQLLREHAGQWVAYHRKQCLGFSTSQRALYKECLDRGFSLDEVLVCSIEPDEPIVVDNLPDH
jgi:hypothetical protein